MSFTTWLVLTIGLWIGIPLIWVAWSWRRYNKEEREWRRKRRAELTDKIDPVEEE